MSHVRTVGARGQLDSISGSCPTHTHRHTSCTAKLIDCKSFLHRTAACMLPSWSFFLCRLAFCWYPYSDAVREEAAANVATLPMTKRLLLVPTKYLRTIHTPYSCSVLVERGRLELSAAPEKQSTWVGFEPLPNVTTVACMIVVT